MGAKDSVIPFKVLFINPLFDGLILSPFLCYSYREKTVQAIDRRENRMKILFIGNSHTFVHYVPARGHTSA